MPAASLQLTASTRTTNAARRRDFVRRFRLARMSEKFAFDMQSPSSCSGRLDLEGVRGY